MEIKGNDPRLARHLAKKETEKDWDDLDMVEQAKFMSKSHRLIYPEYYK